MTRTSHLKTVASALALGLGAAAACVSWSSEALAQTRYTASWASVDQHKMPEWFEDAKFGIYYHWGAFATAAFGSEWYPRNMYDRAGNSAEYQHHLQVYGDPFADWPYNKFLTGANDKSGKFVQFAPKLKSAGGAWDPDAWAQMFIDAGARFAGPVGEHHDGFSNWDSKTNEWNAVAMGPKLNLVKIQADAFRKRGLKFLVSMHHVFHFIGYYQYAPKMTDPSLQKLFGQLPGDQEQQIWSDKLKELIDEFLPDVLWQDAFLYAVQENRRLEFLSYYYNAGLDANKEVVATGKDGIVDDQNTHPGQVLDYERGGPADIKTPPWLTDDSLAAGSWCYTEGMQYYSDEALIHGFIDRVSKGGNLLLNVSPMPDGTFPQRQQDILKAFGTFLKQAGTAIYNTRAWEVYGEGPTKMGGGNFQSPTAGTPSDIRYTKSKDGDAVYAITLGWPGNGKQVTLASVTKARFDVGSGKVFLFAPTDGSAISLPFTQDDSGLHVTLPSTQPYTAIAYAMKISKSGSEPAPTPWLTNGNDADAGVDDGGVAGGGGGNAGGGSSGSGAGGAPPSISGGAPASGGANSSGTGGVAGHAAAGVSGTSTPRATSSGCACTLETAGPGRARAALVALGLAGACLVRSRRRRRKSRSYF